MSLDVLLSIAGALLLISVFANRLSGFLGIPGLLLFIGIGMLAGSDGVIGIEFYDAKMTNYIGSVALAFILFAGGMDTHWQNIRPIWFRGGLLATLGVLLTAVFLFLPAYYVLHLDFAVALLLSVIVSSTDAPAVFMIMRQQSRVLPLPVRSLLEFESGSNDPMAVLLSMGALSFLQTPNLDVFILLQSFVTQMLVGVLFGYAFGKIAAHMLHKMCICYFGLYTVYSVGVVLLVYGITQLAGGNGFLSVYICGIVIGNSPFAFRRGLIRFHDSLSWIMQVGMFLLLGLLVNPGELPMVMPLGILSAFFLIFFSRPAAVFICLYKSNFTLREKFFMSWAGLKGAVPIILATYPLIIGFPDSQFLFNLIFFLVILSVLLQGKTLAYLGSHLGLYDKKDE